MTEVIAELTKKDIRHAVFDWSTAYLRIGELGLSKPEFNEIVKIIEENMKDQ